MPSQEDYNTALDNLDKCNHKVDFILSHCAPSNILHQIRYYFETDGITNFLYQVASENLFKKWFFGHYHIDEDFEGGYMALYQDIIEINFEGEV